MGSFDFIVDVGSGTGNKIYEGPNALIRITNTQDNILNFETNIPGPNEDRKEYGIKSKSSIIIEAKSITIKQSGPYDPSGSFEVLQVLD